MPVNKKILLILAIFTFLFLKVKFSLALEVDLGLGDNPDFPKYFCYLFGLIMNSAAIISAIIVAFGGLYYLVDYGRGKFASEGRAWIKAGILGLLVTTCSYLIAYTINPNITACKLGVLSLVGSNSSNSPINPLYPINIKTYKEIPIGTLTETLLTRTIDCYGFDQEGNPVDGEKTDDGTVTPTYLNHDRADCITQLADGAQRKGNVVATLSNKIIGLMNQCVCTQDTCDRTCGPEGCDDPPDSCPVGFKCTGPCVGAECKQKAGTLDCCPKDSGIEDPKNPGKNLSVKELIESGPISISIDSCNTQTREYTGLDEFRSNNTYSSIKSQVEKIVTINKRKVAVIDTGNCGVCIKNCQECNILTLTPPLYAVCLITKAKCEKEAATCQKNQEKCRKDSPWYKLKLIDQLTYYNGKIEEIKKAVEDDKKLLNDAKTELESPQCYLAMPYVDLLKTQKKTNIQNNVIFTRPFSNPKTGQPILDPQTKEQINVSQYCKGFNYNSSSCLKKCNDMCPDTNKQLVETYKNCKETACIDNCEDCNIIDAILSPALYGACIAKKTTCEKNLKSCLYKKDECIKDIYKFRPCTNSSGDSIPKDFNECITSCQSSCSGDCAKKYSICSEEYKICDSQCKNNSQCVLENYSDCLFNSTGFIDCANQITDQGNIDYCINNAYLCKNGSDQYAGYQDCAQSEPRPSTTITGIRTIANTLFPKLSFLTDWLAKPSVDCSKSYSSSFLFEHPECQKCLEPYEKPDSGSVCYSTLNNIAGDSSCLQLCPEITKCPTSSKCPYCPCDQISDPKNPTQPLAINFSIPNTSTKSNASNPGYTEKKQEIFAHQIVGPQCNEYSYNDDPLTLYCENEWWNRPDREGINPKPMGVNRVCPKTTEIPVGQTVDDARKWADELINNAKKINNSITAIVASMKKAGDAIKQTNGVERYCKCAAKYDTGKFICETGCKYSRYFVLPVTTTDSEGKTHTTPGYWACNCSFIPCNGSPCQQVIDYLSVVWNNYRDLKISYMDFYTIMVAEPRSDIMKELSYSRQTTNDCSVKSSAYGEETRMINCSRAKDEIIIPITTNQMKFKDKDTLKNMEGYCYGKELGSILTTPLNLTDNWYCCPQWSKE